MLFEMQYYRPRLEKPMRVVSPAGTRRPRVDYVLTTLERPVADDDVFDVMLNDSGFRIENMDGRTWKFANGLLEYKLTCGLLNEGVGKPKFPVFFDVDFLNDFVHVIADEAAAAAAGDLSYRVRPTAEVLAELHPPRPQPQA